MIAAAVTDASIKNVPRSLAQKLFHAATTVKNLNSIQSMNAVAHTHASALDQSVSHLVIAHAQKVTSHLLSMVMPAAQLPSACHAQLSQLVIRPLQTTPPRPPVLHQSILHGSSLTQLIPLLASQKKLVVVTTVTIMKVEKDTMAIAGHQLNVLTASVMPTVHQSAQRRNALLSSNASQTNHASLKRPLMVVATLSTVSITIVKKSARVLLASSHHQLVNTTKTVSPPDTTIAVAHTLASATSQSAATFNWLIAQKVTSEPLSRPTNVVQLLDALNVHQNSQPRLVHHSPRLHQLVPQVLQVHMSTQPPPMLSSPRPHQAVLVTPETVEQDTMVKSGQSANVKHAPVLKTSQLNAQRLNATNQLHVHQVKLKLVPTRLIHAAHQSAVLQMKNVKAASSLHAQMLLPQHVKFMKTA